MADPEVMQPEKRMTRDEKRSLEKVIKGDFELTREEFSEAWDSAKQREVAEVNAKYGNVTEKITEAQRTMRDAAEKARRDLEDALRALQQSGVTPSQRNRQKIEVYVPTEFTVSAKERELNVINERYQQIRTKAIRSIAKQELETLRKLALTGIASETAVELLNAIPDAHTVLTRAIADQNQKTMEISNG